MILLMEIYPIEKFLQEDKDACERKFIGRLTLCQNLVPLLLWENYTSLSSELRQAQVTCLDQKCEQVTHVTFRQKV